MNEFVGIDMFLCSKQYLFSITDSRECEACYAE